MAPVSDATVEVWLGIAASEHTASAWGVQYGQACALYAAHRMAAIGYPAVAIAKNAGDADGAAAASAAASSAAGPVTSRKAGDVAETYGGGASSTVAGAVSSGRMTVGDADLALTSYGLAYLRIRDRRAGVHVGHAGAVSL